MSSPFPGDPENARANIDSLEMPAGPDGLYLRLLQTKKHKPQAQGRTWPYVKKGDRVDDEDVTIVEEEDDEDGGDDGGVAIDIEMSQLLANMPRYVIVMDFLTYGIRFTHIRAGQSS